MSHHDLRSVFRRELWNLDRVMESMTLGVCSNESIKLPDHYGRYIQRMFLSVSAYQNCFIDSRI